tara:strand:+ start:25 stop:1386 length:1362 start_codon:yes stop_codon:yes gene_type:complete
MSKYIQTMKDLEAATYGYGSTLGGNSVLKAAGAVASISSGFPGSSDAALSLGGTAAASNLTALYNMVYGQKVWSMINQEINPLSILPKKPYTSSGWRVMTARPQGGSAAAFSVNATTGNAQGNASPDGDLVGGVGENELLDSTSLEALAPEYTTLYMNPKIVAHMFDYSELAAEMAKIDDGVGDLRALIREDMGKFHAESQSKMVVMPLELYDNLGGDTSSGLIRQNYTSLMKIVSNFTEASFLYRLSGVGSGSHANIDADATTLYGNTSRASGGATSFMDAVVNFGGDYQSADARNLTLSILNSVIQDLRLNGGTPKVILTGYDTIQTIADLLQSQERFMDSKEIIPSHNGVKGVKGAEVGFRVATYYDIPMIPAKDMPSTGANASCISDMLFLDTDHIWFATMKPTQYFEDGINHGNPFGVGMLGNRGLYRTMGEIGCTFFKGQAKITNIL